MSSISQLAARPAPGSSDLEVRRYKTAGLGLAIAGLMGTAVSVIGNFTAADGIAADNGYGQTLAWTCGLSIFSFGLVKIAISLTLMGIIVRLWMRVDSIKDALRTLKGNSAAPPSHRGNANTKWGLAKITDTAPAPTPTNRMAVRMWRPMLAMGAMALTAGLVSSWTWASQSPGTESFRRAAAFTQGIEFLGEAFLLSGIAFLLGTILAGLRSGGGEVQESLGLPVTTLKMPLTGKLFVGLMMIGLMIGMLQFVLYLVAMGQASDPASFSVYLNWLGPLRELALGLILAGIVMALVTIANALSFQFNRITTIIRTGI